MREDRVLKREIRNDNMIHDLLCRMYKRFVNTSFYKGFQWFAHGDLEYRILRMIQFSQYVASQHAKIFPQYKNLYEGKDVVVVACGPSASKYKPIPGAIHIAVNRAIFIEEIAFDYLFINDGAKAFSREHMDLLNAYRSNSCVKFYGYQADGAEMISESDVIKAHAHRYAIDNYLNFTREYKTRFPYDLSTQPLAAPGSTVFPALEFALWTNPRRLFLVGCDCSDVGHFYDTKKSAGLPVDQLIRGYNDFAEFAQRFYPETQIISINPVGLKGLFVDQYS